MYNICSAWFLDIVISRVHNIRRERLCLIAHIACTNTLHQVSPVNYHTLTDLINDIILLLLHDCPCAEAI